MHPDDLERAFDLRRLVYDGTEPDDIDARTSTAATASARSARVPWSPGPAR
ncbi:MAG: hypothetical protein U0S36_04465 [Candidatus Nanopelagicales bacterium]